MLRGFSSLRRVTAPSSLLALGLLLGLSLGVQARAAAQPRCSEPPLVLLTVDKSSSMLGELPGGGTKWEAARSAIGEVTGAFEGSMNVGLQIFPFPDRCQPGEVTMGIGPNSSTSIVRALGSPPPTGGNWTPMAQTLDAAATYMNGFASDSNRHVVLITDGWQWCDPYDASTRFTPVNSVMRLASMGVTVHVVGFGGGVDPLTLNRAAVAAGTARGGCNPNREDPMASDLCYHQAHDLAGLRLALDSIASTIADEICDGQDNDCDDRVDEGFDRDEDRFTVCGTGFGRVDPELADCDDRDPMINPDAEEICDGVDNDCDGETDPDCECEPDDEMRCGTNTGVCSMGVQRCVDGRLGECEDSVEPEDETCNGDDDDCDGDTDEDARCDRGEMCMGGRCRDIDDGERRDAGPRMPRDAGADAGRATPPSTDSGCGCRTVTRESGAGASMILGLIGIALLRRRRR